MSPPIVLNLETEHRFKPLPAGCRHKITTSGVKTSDLRLGVTGLDTAPGHDDETHHIGLTVGHWVEGSKLEVEVYPQQESFMYRADISVIDLLDDADFQNGIVPSYSVDTPSSTEPTKIWVAFKKPYQDVPEVIVFMRDFILEDPTQWRFNVWADGVTKAGFWFNSENKDPACLHSLGASWIAVPKRRGTTGSIAATAFNDYKGHTQFNRKLSKLPVLFIAMNQLDADSEYALRFKLITSNISETGFDWRVELGSDSVIPETVFTFLAVDS